MILLGVLLLAFLIRESVINARRKKLKNRINRLLDYDNIDIIYADTDSFKYVSHETKKGGKI